MNKENIKKISEITYDIDNEYGLLIELSEKGKENTEEYNKNLDILFKLVEKLLSNCYQIPYDSLEQILNYFNKKINTNSDNYAYEIAIKTISYVLDKKSFNLEESSNEVEYDESFLEEVPEELYEEDPVLEDVPEKLEYYYYEAMSVIYAEATKKTYLSIAKEKTNNNHEKTYKKELLSSFYTYYKYYFLSSNVLLELISIKSKFNPFLININVLGDFSPLYYNEAINLLDIINKSNYSLVDIDNVINNLFDVSCLEMILSRLDTDRLLKLKDYCLTISKEKDPTNNLPTYNEICLNKIKKYIK